MKIESDVSKNYFLRFNEARGIALHQKKVLKEKKSKVLSYIPSKLLVFILCLVIGILVIYLCQFNFYLCTVGFWIILFAIFYLFAALATLISSYYFRKNRKFNNINLIDKEGIYDESFYGIRMLFKWDKIKGVVVGKYSVVILTDTPVYFYFDISKKEEILKCVRKYGNKNLIIE